MGWTVTIFIAQQLPEILAGSSNSSSSNGGRMFLARRGRPVSISSTVQVGIGSYPTG